MSELPSPAPSIADDSDDASSEGLRARKRRETRIRIAETALRLFLSDGFDGTTLDVIAEASGISRRTFFSYFKSKDDILLFWQDAHWRAIYDDVLKTSPDASPLQAVRDIMVKHMARYTTEEMVAIDTLMRSSPTLMSRKQAFYGEQEQALFGKLCEVWRQPERRPALRLVAMVSMGAMRLTTQTWNELPSPRKPMAKLLRETFESLKSEL
ncbi:TetR/AcrR family transcriptional regulator [Roseateles amylovorans]|uniref:TetR/AcrR family transcriptional regulator n=1 Tax=Roseateles amylovorans TaxID=2978473 RepID=A0ABY6AWE3_9BURK|nr:TetR/AcrR family transcriptional regulator [Roseateles amylovorans]UXH77125.1 TetR/AcrR family transcriptional regulator [Roseateles amylovorans]